MFFSRLFSSAGREETARQIYELIVAKARQPALYRDLAVADTLAGRYDMLVLFAVLVMHRLGEGPSTARDLGQKIFDVMFRDMDRALREMGVGDLSVGRRVRQLAGIFSGRARVYRAAIAGRNEMELRDALRRNLFPDAASEEAVCRLAQYASRCVTSLDRQSMADLSAGRIVIPDFTGGKVRHDA
jgi:cytochrome b pre-mRNA-processing protein 3